VDSSLFYCTVILFYFTCVAGFTLVYCIQTAEDIVRLLYRPGSDIILVAWPQAPVPNSKGTLQRGRKIQKGGKFLRF